MKSQNDVRKIIAVDLDGTLTEIGAFENFWDMSLKDLDNFYFDMEPKLESIRKVNSLYDKGHIIYIFTSRWDVFQSTTMDWLKKHNIKHTFLIMNKPFYNILLDDKSININDIENNDG